jgi:energy-coupling factor transport system permease protein
VSPPPTTGRTRSVHALAWWGWAVAIAFVALSSTNLVALAATAAAIALVLATCAVDSPTARAATVFLRFGLGIVAIRVALGVLLGSKPGGHVLVRLPSATLPGWAAGISVGGPVSVEVLVDALAQGAQLGVALVALGAVNALCSPYRLLRLVPAPLYELGVAATVAVSSAPNAVVALDRIRTARRLRGRPTRGPRALRHLALPMLEGALDRSVELAASMDVRGFGRTDTDESRRRRTHAAMALGIVAASIAVYGAAVPGPPRWIALVATAASAASFATALRAGSTHTRRSRYRPERWDRRASVIALGAAAAIVGTVATAAWAPLATAPPVRPLGVPAVPWGWLVTLLGLYLPAVVASPVAVEADVAART